ncbi:hypothetical protein WJM97_17990 [Okeanomitos corallinicola TIOX110]|uniref:Uncharacterized protein n=1 Tax=Okeanomitos corallinicola TIOX110 TaxID=3133117 RepID=A0ABZ2UV04_9CYAN
MIKLQLKNHKVWQDFTEIVENLDAKILVNEHLELCDYQLCGYWDEQDKYYETINLPRNLEAELISSSIGVTNQERFLQLKFNLKFSVVETNFAVETTYQKVGELILVYNENLEFIDERWFLDSDYLQHL